jgi:chorismate mutase
LQTADPVAASKWLTIQYSRFAGWKFDPATAPTSAPDLSASRSVIDGLNHRMVNEIAAQWPLLQSPACATRSYCPGG